MMITVAEILRRPSFQNATLIAGKEGVTRPVRWVHVGEVPDMRPFLEGNEIVLTTGVGLLTSEDRYRFAASIVEAGGAAIALELGSYFHEAPNEWIEISNAAGLPLIVFKQTVRFLEITQEINGLLIDEHYRAMEELTTLARRQRSVLLNTEGLPKLVELLAHSVGQPVCYQPADPLQEAIAFGDWPVIPGEWPHPMAEQARFEPTPFPHLRQSVILFGQVEGELSIALSEVLPPEEQLFLMIDQTCGAIAQELLRKQALERTKRRQRTAMLETALAGTETEHAAQAMQRLGQLYQIRATAHVYRIGVTDSQDPQFMRRLAHQMEQNNTTLIDGTLFGHTYFAFIGQAKDQGKRSKAMQDFFVQSQMTIGFSGIHSIANEMAEAAREAETALAATHWPDVGPVISWERLGLLRLLVTLSEQELDRLLIQPELGPLLEHDLRYKPSFTETLSALLAHPSSKQEAAEALGIRRQTLYARLRQIEELLGTDVFSPHRTLALQAALWALNHRRQPK